MKLKTIYLILLCLSPLLFHAQKGLSGIWSGKVSNDSTTVRRDQSFEIALTQYREKVYGYSRTTFIVNDTLYYVLKRVKGTVDGDVCEIRDDEIISYSFPGKIDKGIKVTTTFRMNKQDSSWHLDGKWSTNKTKRFYAITGSVALREETDPLNSRIFAHLQELDVAKEIELPQTQLVTTAKQPAVVPAKTNSQPPAENIPTEKVTPAKKEVARKKQAANIPALKDSVVTAKKEMPRATPNANPETAKTGTPVPSKTTPAGITFTPSVPAANVNDRINIMSTEIIFTSDSLELALYDNGEVDGDTVSVLLNGEIIIAREMLKASAMRKTIKTPAGNDEFMLVLYAENLGRYPPNTGLLVVKDGDTTKQIRFSADLKQNAAIIFRRKK
ncbi:MAG: hypothetical protein EOO88_05170 [Pedobacter sp.]|nr:MAG: hypothetical protein EOO88_05170 [Pedobacter sp.]